MLNIQEHTHRWLLPLSFLYGAGTSIRNILFDHGLISSQQYDIPIISIGNITVGGTGKTPLVEYLIRLLSKHYEIAVISRGYGRKSKGTIWAVPTNTAADIGDEPLQIIRKFPNVTMIVDSNRRRAINSLLQKKHPDVILLDDAFQYRYIIPGKSILLVDYNVPITRDWILPAGRLRESASGSIRADTVIVTKCPPDIPSADMLALRQELRLKASQQIFFSSIVYQNLYNFVTGDEKPLFQMPKASILLLSAIARPSQLQNDIARYFRQVRTLSFMDHHRFTLSDIEHIQHEFNIIDGQKFIITTEKDAARLNNCIKHLDDDFKSQIWVLPIETRILQDKEQEFNSKIMQYVQQNLRDCRLA